MTRCPDTESLAAYLDGQLFPEQRDRLEEHLAGCSDCSAAVAESLRFQVLAQPESAGAGSHRRWAAAATLAVVCMPTTLWLSHGERRPWDRDPRAPLIAATAEERPLLARLTGDYRWAPPAETLRNAPTSPASVPWGYYAAAEVVRRDAIGKPSADRLGALADAHLLTGDADRALATLGRAIAAAPRDAELQSDLAAVYLARGQQQGNSADLAAAAEAASTAIALDPSLAEARFNLALALQELHLPGEARRGWESYLDVERDSQWVAEAERNLHLLGAPEITRTPSEPELRRAAESSSSELPKLVAEHRFAARRLVERQLLPEWGSSYAAGNLERAGKTLGAAAAIGRAYAKQTGNQRIRQQVEAAAAASGGAALRLATAHQALAHGELAIETMNAAAAQRQLQQAASLFPAGTVGHRRAEVELLVAKFAAGGSGNDLRAAADSMAAAPDDDLAIRARLFWIRGMLAAHHGEARLAIGHYLQALAASDRLGESEPSAWLHYLLTEVYTLAGDQRSTWQHRAAAVAAVPHLEDRHRAYGILIGAGMWSLLDGRPRLAEAFLAELSGRDDAQLPLERAQLLLWRARVRLQLGEEAAASGELAGAAMATLQVVEPAARTRMAAELAATRGATATSPTLAVAALSRALNTFRRLRVEPRLPGLLLQRALAHHRAGDTPAMERDLREGIARLEAQPRLDPREEVWLTRLDGAHALYDQMVALELERHRPDRAFAWTERARTRALERDAGRPAGADPATLAEISQLLDGDTTLLSFALVGDRAMLWRVDDRGARFVQLQSSATEIADRVAGLDADLAAGEWTRRSAESARELYRALIAPASLPPSTTRVVIVADKSLATLPFAALVGESGRYLTQDVAVATSPSASFYVRARKRWRSLSLEATSVLALGDPRVDTGLFPGLGSLPGAADEARRVAALYPRATLVTGANATREALLDGLGDHSILHLATHATIDDSSPSRSALALAPLRTGDGSGALYADQISRFPLARTRTVVLAACGSGGGPSAGSEGRLGLPRAFLSADVPAVVAALWPIGDRRSVALLTALHTRLRAGDDAATALRQAQLQLLSSHDHRLRSPATWALFQALGG